MITFKNDEEAFIWFASLKMRVLSPTPMGYSHATTLAFADEMLEEYRKRQHKEEKPSDSSQD